LLRPEITFAKAFTEAPFDVCEISFSNTVTAVSKIRLNVRFAPKATEVLRCREASRCANSGQLTW
jgi:hypothetical protein